MHKQFVFYGVHVFTACAMNDTNTTPRFSSPVINPETEPALASGDAAPVRPAVVGASLSSQNPSLFPAQPGETPRAYSAFVTFFQIGPSRALQSVADRLGCPLQTVKNWSSRFDWGQRILDFESGLLNQQAKDRAQIQRESDQQWAARLDDLREHEWDVSQKLLNAARCFLETFGEEELSKMTLAQVSRALLLSSTLGRRALEGAEVSQSSEGTESSLPTEFEEALRRAYGPAASAQSAPSATASPNLVA